MPSTIPPPTARTCSICGAEARYRLNAKIGHLSSGDTALSEHRYACVDHMDNVYEILRSKYGSHDVRIYMDRIEKG